MSNGEQIRPALFDKVRCHNAVCVVTNAHLGNRIVVSPVGNSDGPAKYFTVRPDEVEILKD
jgi:hypothetical protein